MSGRTATVALGFVRRIGRWAAAGAVGVVAAGPAAAESLRCGAGSVQEGDSRLALLRACGPPAMTDETCRTTAAGQWVAALGKGRPDHAAAACAVVQTWVYDRGPGHLTAQVFLREGRITAIQYGRLP